MIVRYGLGSMAIVTLTTSAWHLQWRIFLMLIIGQLDLEVKLMAMVWIKD